MVITLDSSGRFCLEAVAIVNVSLHVINFERAPRRERLTHELQAVFAPILGVHSEILRSTTERDRRLRSLSVNDGILRDSLRDAVRRDSSVLDR